MATAMKKCRVCGKEYPACHTFKRNTGVFRWQEVACSPECGNIYLGEIIESRKKVSPDNTKVKNTECAEMSVDEEIEEEETDKELDEYFDESEDSEI